MATKRGTVICEIKEGNDEIQFKISKGGETMKIGIPANPNGSGGSTGVMKLETLEENNFLKEVWKKHPGRISLTWHVTDFGEAFSEVPVETINWETQCEFFDRVVVKMVVRI